MHVSEARLAANRLNALKSSGPKTPEGKESSRRNGLKHGLTGRGVVVPAEEAAEIGRRVEALEADLKPRSPVGAMLIVQMATLSARAERAAGAESAAIAMRVRHAVDDFDEERVERADRLLEAIGEDPRRALRKLKKSPEGVERLVDAWRDLRDDLTHDPRPIWTADHLTRAAQMTGIREAHAEGSRLGALSKGLRGDFQGLEGADGGGLDDETRKGWARAQLIERIDAEIAALEAHHETLDFELIELDRLEAPDRALFDPSKEATLARRYETEARRGFFKALKEFRQAEAATEARAEVAPGRPPAPKVASSWEPAPPPDREPARTYPDAPMGGDSVARGPDGRPLVIGRSPKPPG